MTTIIETERLILRTWRKEDENAYFKINQDPKVMEFVLSLSTLKQINDFISMVNNHQDKHGYSVWAAELKKTRELIGSFERARPWMCLPNFSFTNSSVYVTS